MMGSCQIIPKGVLNPAIDMRRVAFMTELPQRGIEVTVDVSLKFSQDEKKRKHQG
jgi:hypothetical protein